MAWCRRRRPRRGWLPASPACCRPEVEPTKEETTTSSTPTPTPSPAAAVPKAKSAASTGLWDVLAFSGPAPEPINRRLAMALAVKASRGGELLEEASSGGGLA
uniref:Uncharacterized protein n=1 Tax=Oryza rufipogon TaxID=4529 RepID=A0A0E0P6J1_ORYRU